MPIVTVTKSDASKSGAPRVFFDNKHQWADAYYVSKKIEPPEVGATIDAVTASKVFDDGKTIWFLNSWKAVKTEKPPGGSMQTIVRTSSVCWPIDAGDCSRMVSNIVAQAITAGLIKHPTDIHPWIGAAYAALQGLRKGEPIDFQDAMPPFVEPDGHEPEQGEDFESDIPF